MKIDKLSDSITIKVPPRIKLQIKDKAMEKGIDLSELCRNWIFEKLHESNFRMKDYLNNG
jgi:hypothetical protein